MVSGAVEEGVEAEAADANIIPLTGEQLLVDDEDASTLSSPSSLERGDIIVSRYGPWHWLFASVTKWLGMEIYWTHAACFVGQDVVDETVIDKAVVETTSQGYVDVISLQQEIDTHGELLYLRVDTSELIRDSAIKFMLNKTFTHSGEKHWYDWYSLILDTKQVEEGNESDPKLDPGYYYYCSELVWAGYKKYDVDLDPTGGRVTPDDLNCTGLTKPIGGVKNLQRIEEASSGEYISLPDDVDATIEYLYEISCGISPPLSGNNNDTSQDSNTDAQEVTVLA